MRNGTFSNNVLLVLLALVAFTLIKMAADDNETNGVVGSSLSPAALQVARPTITPIPDLTIQPGVALVPTAFVEPAQPAPTPTVAPVPSQPAGASGGTLTRSQPATVAGQKIWMVIVGASWSPSGSGRSLSLTLRAWGAKELCTNSIKLYTQGRFDYLGGTLLTYNRVNTFNGVVPGANPGQLPQCELNYSLSALVAGNVGPVVFYPDRLQAWSYNLELEPGGAVAVTS